MLGTGCALGADVSASWLALQEAASVGPGELSADALLAGPAAALAFDRYGTDTQHSLTVKVEDRRALALEADLARLPAGHPFRDAYDEIDDVARSWVQTLPWESSRLDSVSFTEDMCGPGRPHPGVRGGPQHGRAADSRDRPARGRLRWPPPPFAPIADGRPPTGVSSISCSMISATTVVLPS